MTAKKRTSLPARFLDETTHPDQARENEARLRKSLLIFTQNDEDLRMAEWIAFASNSELHIIRSLETFTQVRRADRACLCFLDAGIFPPERSGVILKHLKLQPHEVIWIVANSTEFLDRLRRAPTLHRHFIARRSQTEGLRLYSDLAVSQLLQAEERISLANTQSLSQSTLGELLRRYSTQTQNTENDTDSQAVAQLRLRKLSHRTLAVESMQSKFFSDLKSVRVRRILTQALDELLLNALIQAPVLSNGLRYRANLDLTKDFELLPNEQVEVRLWQSDQFWGIQVTDFFGSLKPETLLKSLASNHGLANLLGMGASLCFQTQPGVATQALALVPRKNSIRELKKEWAFFSV